MTRTVRAITAPTRSSMLDAEECALSSLSRDVTRTGRYDPDAGRYPPAANLPHAAAGALGKVDLATAHIAEWSGWGKVARMEGSGDRERRALRIRGVVQGVGFRPAMYRLADAL